MDFIKDNFDKLLLVSVFLVLVGMVVHFSHDGRDAAVIAWGREQAGTVLGALLGLITGAVLRNGNKHQPPPAEPPKEQTS